MAAKLALPAAIVCSALAFEPAHLDGKFHEIVVKSRGADHRIRARSDYFAGK